MRKLKCWCGIGQVYQFNESQSNIYVAAYSISDITALCSEVGLVPPNYHEIKNYWVDTWGKQMDGIPIERGVWISKLHQKMNPIKLEPK